MRTSGTGDTGSYRAVTLRDIRGSTYLRVGFGRRYRHGLRSDSVPQKHDETERSQWPSQVLTSAQVVLGS